MKMMTSQLAEGGEKNGGAERIESKDSSTKINEGNYGDAFSNYDTAVVESRGVQNISSEDDGIAAPDTDTDWGC